MNSQPVAPFTGLSIQEVVDITVLCRATIYRAMQEAQLGSPAHFEYVGGVITFKVAGLCQLIGGLERIGEEVPAKSLAAAVKIRRQQAATVSGVTSPDGDRETVRRWDLQHERQQEQQQEDAA